MPRLRLLLMCYFLVLWPYKLLSLCLDLCGSLVGTFSGSHLIYYLTPQFVLFGSIWTPGRYLEWALPSLQGCELTS